LKNELAARDAELLRLKNELAQSVKAGKEKDSELSNKVTELSNKATELSDLNTRVSQQAQAIKDQDAELFNLKKQNSDNALELSQHATTITELEQQITRMEEKAADDHQGYSDTIESHQEEQEKLEKEVKELKEAKSAAEEEIQGLKTEKASLFEFIKNSAGGDPKKVKKLEEKVKELESQLKSPDWAKFVEDYDSQDVTFSSDRTALELDSALNDVRKVSQWGADCGEYSC
jgi:chromosome segregation ATPase